MRLLFACVLLLLLTHAPAMAQDAKARAAANTYIAGLAK